MRKIIATIVAVVTLAGAGAQALKLGTIEGTAFLGPLVSQVLKEAGYDSSVAVFTQEALIQALAKGEVDGAFFLAEPLIAQAKGAIRISARLMQADFCAVATDPTVKIANPGDLRKYKVGVVKDNVAHGAVTRGMKTVQAENDVEEFKLLASGQVQAILAVEPAIPGLAKAAGLDQYIVQQPPVLRSPTYVALAASKSGIKKDVEAVFKKWVDSGQWEAEMSKAAPPAGR
jgi:ABC-type amino acid transport substrate-binding protein